MAFTIAVSVVLFLPLLSLFRHPDVSLTFKALVALLGVLSAALPIAGVLALVALLPLALALQYFLGPLPTATGITEALMMGFAAGAATRLAWPRSGERDRLSRPALILAVVVLASVTVDLVGQQAASTSRDVAMEAWRHVTERYFFSTARFATLHQAVRWITVLVVAVLVERAIRRRPAFGPAVVRIFLVGGAAAACFAALRLASLLLEGKIDPDRLAILFYILTEVRITALHADPNAAGSYFALFLVPAMVIGVTRRSPWLLGVVCPLVALAFGLAQSRAAMLAVGVVLALMALVPLVRARRFVLGVGVIAALLVLGVAARIITGPSHASLGRATVLRQEMTLLALDMTRDAPFSGVGVGRFRTASRSYITSEYPAVARVWSAGQNAHNNFLQVLAELGVPAFIAFLWLVLPPARRWLWPAAAGSDETVYASAMAAGVVTFLVSALFGHPLLIVQVAAAFFTGLGITAALAPAPAGRGRLARALTGAAVVSVIATLPWRLGDARVIPGDSEGVGPVAGAVDGVPYRALTTDLATWLVDSRAVAVSLPLRWDRAAASDCEVSVLVDGREINRVRPRADAWMPFRTPLPSARSRDALRELGLAASDERCRLLVGPMDVAR